MSQNQRFPGTGRLHEHEFDGLAYRRTLGHLATGVTIITTRTEDGIHGMTANAVVSVSLNPPLILICLDRRARMKTYIESSGRFGINLLSERQAPMSRYFARSWRSPQPPEHQFEEWAGVPYLAGSMGALSCRVSEHVEGGDHLVVIARVVGLRLDDPTAAPLLFYRGGYAALTDRVAGPAEQPELQSAAHFQLYYRDWEPEDEAGQGPSSPGSTW